MGVYHEGERAVQERAGVRAMSERVGNGIHAEIPDAAQEFLEARPFVVLGARDPATGHLWATALFGAPGFAHPIDERTIFLAAQPAPADPLRNVLARAGGSAVGLLAIEPATRRRMRLNGDARSVEGGLLLRARQVYANCPKYIQTRVFVASDAAPEVSPAPTHVRRGPALTPAQAARIATADTFFIATAHPEGGADTSHRGGNPGFIHVSEDGRSLLFPDYSGNKMFNTLGNIAATGKAGLLFVDWQAGDLLHLTGDARILWDDPRAAAFPGAERLVEITLREVVERPGASPLRQEGAVGYSRFNPA